MKKRVEDFFYNMLAALAGVATYAGLTGGAWWHYILAGLVLTMPCGFLLLVIVATVKAWRRR